MILSTLGLAKLFPATTIIARDATCPAIVPGLYEQGLRIIPSHKAISLGQFITALRITSVIVSLLMVNSPWSLLKQRVKVKNYSVY